MMESPYGNVAWYKDQLDMTRRTVSEFKAIADDLRTKLQAANLRANAAEARASHAEKQLKASKGVA